MQQTWHEQKIWIPAIPESPQPAIPEHRECPVPRSWGQLDPVGTDRIDDSVSLRSPNKALDFSGYEDGESCICCHMLAHQNMCQWMIHPTELDHTRSSTLQNM